ncbi:transcriptional repressor MprA [archaeon BMS3Bbin16]|nr:transcriptional repressor MprA [archaeon BMS3Bbin16]
MNGNILKILSQKGVLEILENLDKKRSLKYKELEEFVGNPSTTSRRLNSLEKKGIVERHVSSEKYRPVYYQLTDKGRKLLSHVRELRENYG